MLTIPMLLRRLALSFSIAFWCQGVVAASAAESFAQGIQSFDQGQIEESIRGFQAALEAEPHNSTILYNLGVASFKADRKGLALGLWRKALAINPDLFRAHDALNFGAKALQVDPHLKNGGALGYLQSQWLTMVTFHQLMALGLLNLLASGWLLIGYWGQRQAALENDTALPPTPTVGAALALVSAFFLTFSVFKAIDLWTRKGTVISAQADVLSGPAEAASKLFYLREGTPVEVIRSQDRWVQIRSSASGAGWLPSQHIFITSGKDLW